MPVVVTIHDCTYFDHPEWHQRSKALFFRRAIRVAAQRAAVLVCVSNATADRLRANCDVRAPVMIAPHGVDHARFSPHEPEPGSDSNALDELQQRVSLDFDRPVILYVGTLEPRKGLVTLVRAFDLAAERLTEPLLVLAGQQGWGTAELDSAVGSLAHRARVLRVGYVSDTALPALLRRAAVVAYPALDEGFGLPALEAMASGTPLVTTIGTPMAELAGDAGVLVPPGDVLALRDALVQTVEERGTVAALERRRIGLELASRRISGASAAVHVAAYRTAADG